MKHQSIRAIPLSQAFGQAVSHLNTIRLEDAMARLPESWSDAERRDYAVSRLAKESAA